MANKRKNQKVTACPVAPLVRQYADLTERYIALEESTPPVAFRHRCEHNLDNIADRQTAIRMMASHMQPASAVGAAFLTAQIGAALSIMRSSALSDYDRGAYHRRMARMVNLVLRYLELNGGALPNSILVQDTAHYDAPQDVVEA